MKYVVIGASAAGLAAAEQIRKTDSEGEITVLTNEAYYPYSRPSISYYLKDKVAQKDMPLRRKQLFAERRINVVTNSEVTSIDRKEKTVKCKNKKYPYDKLCIATGSKPFVPPMENISGKDNAFTFLDFASAKAIKAAANSNSKAVVIGAGLIGLKAAEGLVKICKSVDVVELAPRVLPSILDDKAAKIVKKHLEENNIKIHLENTVVKVKSKGRKITGVVLGNDKQMPCDLLVIAVGVRPQTELAENAGLETERGIITDCKTMQTSDKDIYAAGDCVVSTDMLDNSKKIIALWPNAVNQGIAAGSQMAGGEEIFTSSYSVNAIDFFGMRICTCGLINAKSDKYSEKISQTENTYKRLIFEGNRLVGFVLINSSENAGIYTSLISNKVDVSTLEGDIMSSPSLFLFNKEVRKSKLTGGVEV